MKFVNDTKIPEQPYPELRGVLEVFVEDIAAELGANLVGVYLVGSIATGDFDLDSDIDFLVVTHLELSETNKRSLQDIQGRIYKIDCYPAKHLEGSYISLSDLNDWSTVGKKELYYFDNGSIESESSTHDNQFHVRWILRERGITLVGPKPDTLVQPVPLDLMLGEVRSKMLHVRDIFQEEIHRPLNFWNSRFGQSFVVLTYCRMLHTLHTGTVQSKKAGVQWAKGFVNPKWIKSIEQAWREREGVRFMVKIHQRAKQTTLDETLEFIKSAVALLDDHEAGKDRSSQERG